MDATRQSCVSVALMILRTMPGGTSALAAPFPDREHGTQPFGATVWTDSMFSGVTADITAQAASPAAPARVSRI